ncbi:MAG: hypothetical protein H6739_31415 [Alphaproteobacteria bacterium]|nr:hypothetical protein [Alphaproteobacteria bacterium]
MQRALLLAALPFALLACGDPMASGSARTLDDGVHVSVNLTDLDEAVFAGRTVKDGDEIVIPYDELLPGATTIPFEAEGLGEWDKLTILVDPNKTLRPACDVGGPGSVSGGDNDLLALKCAVEGGELVLPLTLPKGATLSVEPGRVEGSTAYLPVMGGATEVALTTQASVGAGRAKPYPVKLTVTASDGRAWSTTTEVSSRTSPLEAWVGLAPDTLKALGRQPGARKLALFESGGRYWVEGEAEGRTVADIDLLVRAEGDGEPQDMGTCNFRTMEGGHASAKAVGVAQTFVAYDVSGAEVARTTLSPGGCPGYATFKEGEILRVVPGDGQVRAWVKTLLQ